MAPQRQSLPLVFTYEELESSTNRFDSKRKIRNGGFRSFYLDQLYDNQIVTVKYLHNHHPTVAGSTGARAFSSCNEILTLFDQSPKHAAYKDDRPDGKEVVVELRRIRNQTYGGGGGGSNGGGSLKGLRKRVECVEKGLKRCVYKIRF